MRMYVCVAVQHHLTRPREKKMSKDMNLVRDFPKIMRKSEATPSKKSNVKGLNLGTKLNLRVCDLVTS